MGHLRFPMTLKEILNHSLKPVVQTDKKVMMARILLPHLLAELPVNKILRLTIKI